MSKVYKAPLRTTSGMLRSDKLQTSRHDVGTRNRLIERLWSGEKKGIFTHNVGDNAQENAPQENRDERVTSPGLFYRMHACSTTKLPAATA